MIKLKFRFDVSLSKIILGVAGISATICAFHYFSLENSKIKGSIMNDVKNGECLKKDNKVSSLVTSKPTVDPKLSSNKKDNKLSSLVTAKPKVDPKVSRNESAKKEFSSRKSEIDVGITTNKIGSKGSNVSKRVFKKLSVCKNKLNLNCKMSASESNPNCKNLMSKTDINFEKTSLKSSSKCKTSN